MKSKVRVTSPTNKINYYEAEWDDTGGVLKTNMPSMMVHGCPRCKAELVSGVEHRCGDRAEVKTKKEKK